MEQKESLFKKRKKQTAVEVVIDNVKDLLINQKLKPGDLLPSESEICEQLEVSRGSTREALKILSAYGVLDIRRGNGTYVTSAPNENMFLPLLFQILVRDRDLSELIEVRQLLEGGLLALAIEHGTEEDIEDIRKACDAFENAIGKPGFSFPLCCELDIELHRRIAIAAHNSILQVIYDFVMELFQPSMGPGNVGVVESHRGIVEAICNRDLERAEYWLGEHTKSWMSMKNK